MPSIDLKSALPPSSPGNTIDQRPATFRNAADSRISAQIDDSLTDAAAHSYASTSHALRNLRGAAIVLVVAMHAVLPYTAFAKLQISDFTRAPYEWLAIPIVDTQRWFGFDLFAAWIDVYLMSLMFFLSGLFACPSLVGKGARLFLARRLTRLGAPFVFGLVVVMPIALFPVYFITTHDYRLFAYAQAYLALPFWPSGPMWFLWMLLVLTAATAALHGLAPRSAALLRHLASSAASAPGYYFVGLAIAGTVAYVPLAFGLSPWDWTERGPFSFQLSRPLLYSVYYLAGYGVGAQGLGNGLLAATGVLMIRWPLWLLGALVSLLLWMGLTGLTLSYPTAAPPALRVLAEASYAWADASSVFFMLAASLRLRALRFRLLEGLSRNALGIYVLHYAPLVWLQFAMMEAPLPAVAKALIVLGGTLLLAYAGTSALRRAPEMPRSIGEPLARG